MSETPEAQLWNLQRGALVTRALAVAAELHVADALADGPRPVADLARDAGANEDSLHRVLRALASDGVFAEVSPGVFANTAASELMRAGGGWDDFALLFGTVWHRSAGDLEARTGEPSFPRTFGTDFWSWLALHPEERAAFDRAMGSGKERQLEQLVALGWRGDETVVDVGGGNGALVVQLLQRLPDLHGIVFDLPETNVDKASLGDRCTFVAGSFFESVPTGDAFVLSGILHDWDDEHAAAILRTIREIGRASCRERV